MEGDDQKSSVAEDKIKAPRKGKYRQRAHCNPLSDTNISYPLSPDYVDWSTHFPSFYNKIDPLTLQLNTWQYPIQYEKADDDMNGRNGVHPVILDVGCGYGGLLVALSEVYPTKLIMGMEIREKVTNFVGERIRALRVKHKSEEMYNNISVLRSNVMKFLVNYFRKHQLEKLFFCYPDPHFKKGNWKRRIISASMLSLYAFVLRPSGLLYTVTDVYDLHCWMKDACNSHPLFCEVPQEELKNDVCCSLLSTATEEGKKVMRAGEPSYICVFKRIDNPPVTTTNQFETLK